MEIIVIPKTLAHGRVHLRRGVIWIVLAAILTTAGLLVYGGVQYGIASVAARYDTVVAQWSRELNRQGQEIDRAILSAENNLNVLALRLGRMQAQVARLDALGERLVETAVLDESEFAFSEAPAMGGPENSSSARAHTVSDFLYTLESLASRLDDRTTKLQVLESALTHRKLETEVHPTGRPVAKGWLSSKFGYRIDPLSGKKTFHRGVDFSAKPGTEILAVASGVVVFSGRRPGGLGNLVEISHGNSYSTLYAHNERNLVERGDTVKQGQPIALMGSTGRSTGTHVHFEVHRDGKFADPRTFMKSDL